MDRVRVRVKDKRGARAGQGVPQSRGPDGSRRRQETFTGTPQGGILSPLMANVALSVLDEHLTGPWKPGRGDVDQRSARVRRRNSQPNWRVVRYADDFVVLGGRLPF